MFACICHAVPEDVVADAARAGASTAEIAQATRAGTSCGRCWEVLSTIVLQTKRCDRTGAPCTGCRDDEGERD